MDPENIPIHSSLDCIDGDGGEEYVGVDHRGDAFFRANLIGASFSFCGLFLVGMLILSDKRIRGHPNNIIAFICMSDAFTYFQYMTRYVVCGFDYNTELNKLFATTV